LGFFNYPYHFMLLCWSAFEIDTEDAGNERLVHIHRISPSSVVVAAAALDC